ncbi:hypothetical protein B7494_g2142 [Chlorociboria aeruginascens]|nr:hypothetical protein B7494_g2142 [Chlorociboria aeruginascens]
MEKSDVDIETSPEINNGQASSGDLDQAQYASKSQNQTSFSDYLRIFTYSTLMDRIILGMAISAEIGTGVTLPLMNIIFGDLVTNFTSYFLPDTTTTKAEFTQSLDKFTYDHDPLLTWHASLYIVYIFIARWFLSYFATFTFRMISLRISAKLRREYLKALFSLPIAVVDTLPSGLASNTITTTANVLQIGISEKLGIFFQFTALAISAIIIAFNWALTLVTSSTLLFVGIVYGTIIPIIMKMTREVEHADGKASSIAGEVLGSIRMIVACGAEGRIAQRYSGWIEESRRRGLKMSLYVGAQYSPLFFSIYATLALCFWYGVKLLTHHHIDNIGTIIIVLMSVMMMAMSFGQTAAPIMAASKAASAATDFFALIDAPKPPTTGSKDPDVSSRDDIVFRDVTFAYPSRPHVKVLDNLGIRFPSGKITAIVGASGSGKSTIVGLLERWYELNYESNIVIPPSAVKPKDGGKEEDSSTNAFEETKEAIALSGSIVCGETNLEKIDLKWWRSQIGLVQQEPFIFNDTIFRNVEYGLIGSRWENEDTETKRGLVEKACKEAFADEFIDKLPSERFHHFGYKSFTLLIILKGYETQVGDSGIKLSGGQRQRLAIARSIIKQPAILVLDEATSSIDVRGEKIVQDALDRASEGRTTVTIAHRLSTIKRADNIVVLKKGQVVEQGTHDSLLSNPNGAYSALVNAQQLSMGEPLSEDLDLINKSDEPLARQMSAASGTVVPREDMVYERKDLIRSFGLLLYEQRTHWLIYTLLIIGCMGAGGYLFAQIVQVFTYTGQRLVSSSEHWSLMFFFLALGIAVAYFMMGSSSNTVSTHISCTYRQQYFESILAKPITFFDAEENSSGTLAARVANDPTQLQQLLGINMGMVYVAIFNIMGCVIIGFVFGWKLTILVTFVSLPIIVAAGYYRVRYEIQFESMNQAVFAESSKFAAEAIGAFRAVSALTMEDMICQRYNALLQGHVTKAFGKAKYSSAVFAASDSVQLLCMALGFWYGGKLLATREYTPLNFFVVYMAVMNGAESAGNLLSFGPNFAQAAAAANRILSFRAPDVSNLKATAVLQDTEGGVKIELKDLWFKYPTRDVPIFSGLNITIEKGQFAALVGPSGCGKTSVISLLERFYDVQKGGILCNGRNISELDVREYRKCISLVAQEPTLFQGTIKENILLGVDENTSNEVLQQACRDAEIHDFITSLPEGYNTDVGTKGVALSGGQKQRISIARSLIRDPSILLLDEATSSLDSESEKLVQASFERAAKGRTTVVVAHRLATVQNADIIFVMGEGRVLEQGDHKTLLRKRGVYYQMCQSQALDR